MAYDAASMNELRKWNEQYGEGGSRRRSPFGFGDWSKPTKTLTLILTLALSPGESKFLSAFIYSKLCSRAGRWVLWWSALNPMSSQRHTEMGVDYGWNLALVENFPEKRSYTRKKKKFQENKFSSSVPPESVNAPFSCGWRCKKSSFLN